jgi:hypothetical protein
MKCQRLRLQQLGQRCEALAEDVGLPLDKLRGADKQERDELRRIYSVLVARLAELDKGCAAGDTE